ncbi:LytTR family DNA-binding domain-containing protein [Clostridiaceae bacterium M8S5]|nr:LytTR family DNA-binding domain-containing protein [Clostridiaceae bacterium M8S5]
MREGMTSDKTIYMGKQLQNFIAVVRDEEVILIKNEEIYYIEKIGRKSYIHTKNDSFVTSKTISYYENRLCENCFFRCYRSCIVNLIKVKKIVPQINYTYNIYFEDINQHVPLSRDRIKQLKSLLGI